MSISLLNFGMLFGLIGLTVPIVVHLLNRRRFDVVQWGAMQFLELGERTRQRIRLSDLLLLLLRLLLIALLVLAFARPFAKGGSWIRSLYPEPVDLVIVIDSSYSMGLSEDHLSPHVRAIQVCHELLDDLTAVDRVAIIDARDQPRLVTPSPVTDVTRARLELDKLLPPDGDADLIAAVSRGCQLLTQTFSTRRQIVVVTDRQRRSWRLDESPLWNEMSRLRQSAAVPIELTAISTGAASSTAVENFQVAPIEASRDVVVQQTPVTFSTRVKYTGPEGRKEGELSWSVDGQRLSSETVSLQLQNGEEAVQQFTTRFTSPGSHVVSASLTVDDLPGDNQIDVVVEVVDELAAAILVDAPPVEGEFNQQANENPSERFLQLAYGDTDERNVWVRLNKQRLDLLDEQAWKKFSLLFTTEDRLSDVDQDDLNEFLAGGGALVVFPPATNRNGDNSDAVWRIDGRPVLPFQYQRERTSGANETAAKMDSRSFAAPWLERFANNKTDLSDAAVLQFWEMQPLTDDASEVEADSEDENGEISVGPVTVDARLETGEPLFARRFVGRGQILQSAIPFDGESNDIVRQRAFVPFVHELAFGLVQTASRRTLPLGQPLVLRGVDCQPLEISVEGPADQTLTAKRVAGSNRIEWILQPPALSGLYRFDAACQATATSDDSDKLPFAVFASRAESDLTPLSQDDQADMETTYGITWQPDSKTLLAAISTASSGIEVWPLLLFAVTGLLVCELFLTRRLVQGGHISSVSPTE